MDVENIKDGRVFFSSYVAESSHYARGLGGFHTGKIGQGLYVKGLCPGPNYLIEARI